MRILDKNQDFYDYLQYVYHDFTYTLDRTGSKVLSKQRMIEAITFHKYWADSDIGDYEFLLLQVGHRFWLLAFEVTRVNKNSEVVDYTLHCLARWSNYNKQRRLIELSMLSFGWKASNMLTDAQFGFLRPKVYNYESIEKRLESVLIPAINNNDYRIKKFICQQVTANKDEGWDFPILKEAGFSSCIEPLEIFLALEEYFSLEKQGAERTESEGLTNNEKIENHGFDTKISFRGKPQET